MIAGVLILVISLVALPNVDSLTRAHSEISLPSNVESEAAKLIKNEWGNKKKNTYEVAVVFNKKSGKLTETDQGNIEASIDRLTSNQKKNTASRTTWRRKTTSRPRSCSSLKTERLGSCR